MTIAVTPKRAESKKFPHNTKKIRYKISIPELPSTDPFYPEYVILLKTVDSVNSFDELYQSKREGASGPSTHAQQDLYRAMLVFACAGLDVFLKQLLKTKLATLAKIDPAAKGKFKEFVKRGMKRDERELMNTLAFALISDNPQEDLLNEYLKELTRDSLQSMDQLRIVCDAAGLDTKAIFTENNQSVLKAAFDVRNQIIHEMDINLSLPTGSPGYRTRRQRKYPNMEMHIKNILTFAQDFFTDFREKFLQLENKPLKR